MSGPEFMLIHPRLYRYLVDVAARDRWQECYRAYRNDLRAGKVTPGWRAQEIRRVYEFAEPRIPFTVGRVQGMSIVKTV